MVLTLTGECCDERGTKVTKTVVYTGPPSWRKCSWREGDRQADFLLSGSWYLSNFKAGAGFAFPCLCLSPLVLRSILFNYCSWTWDIVTLELGCRMEQSCDG
jgi:hypothetical protein